MPFKGITFAGQNVTPKNDGGLYASHHGDGILWGCSMTVSGDDLVIQSGEFIAGGRVCFVDGATSVDLSDRTLTNGYIQVVMDFDMSQSEGNQWNIHRPLIENPSSPTFSALTQNNINDTDTLYQVELAIIQVSAGVMSIYKTMPNSPLVGIYLSRLYAESDPYLVDTYVDSLGSGVRNIVNVTEKGGIHFPAGGSANAVVYGSGDSVFIRPNGVYNDTGRATFYANGDFRIAGQMLGGTTTLTGNALVSSVTGNTVVAKVDSGLDATARYMVFGYFGGSPSNSNAGSTDMAIDVDGSAYRLQSIFSNSSVAKFQTMDAWVIGATSKIELRVWTSAAYNWNNIVAQLQVVRIA